MSEWHENLGNREGDYIHWMLVWSFNSRDCCVTGEHIRGWQMMWRGKVRIETPKTITHSFKIRTLWMSQNEYIVQTLRGNIK